MLISRISTNLITLCVLSLAARSFGNLKLSLEPWGDDDRQLKRKVTCTSDDDGAALIVNSDLRSSSPSTGHSFRIRDSQCALTDNNRKECKAHWAYWQNDTKSKWNLTDTRDHPMGPVFDYRWEDFKEYSTEFGKSEIRHLNLNGSGTIVFSVRGLRPMWLKLCELNELYDSCSWITIPAKLDEKSIIRSYSNNSTEFTEPLNNCKEDDSAAQFNHLFVSEHEWRTFILRWDENEMNIEAANDAACTLRKIYGRLKKITDLVIRNFNETRVRFHSYKYFLTTEPNTKLTSDNFYHSEQYFCVEMLVSLCPECKLEIRIVDLVGKKNWAIGSIDGASQSTSDRLPTWQYVKQNETLDKFQPTNVKLEISTQIYRSRIQGRWAIDGFRECPPVGAERISRASIRGTWNGDEHTESTVGCQKLSYEENSVVKCVSKYAHDSPTSQPTVTDPKSRNNRSTTDATIDEIPIKRSNSWIAIILIVAIFFFVFYIWRRKLLNAVRRMRRQDLASYWPAITNFVKSVTTCTSHNTPPWPVSADTELSGIVSVIESVSWNRYSHPVNTKDFEDYVKDSIASGLLKSQFTMFPRGLNRPCKYGTLPQNKAKNRYSNIVAYDDTRVILEKIPGDPYSDYINANYVEGFRKTRSYIAAQGPKSQTVVDFWRMIWQEETLVICMLANVVEGQKVKCEQYWPDFGASQMYGDIDVMTVSHQIFADYTFRTFRVSCKDECRKVKHLHYTGWPDHTVPMYSNSVIAYFKKLLTTPIGKGPIVVHCSAGVGRTGTVILCDICLHRAVSEGAVDVLAEMKKLRECRLNMVDNELQYIFTHIVLAECLISLPTELPCNNELPTAIEELKKELPQHIERLRETVWQDQLLHFRITPRPPLPEQLEKNRFPELAPVSPGLVYLERYPRNCINSDYISAVIVDGLKVKKQYLASQLPLPSTLSDFWRLVAEQRIELVIILQQPDLTDPTCCDIVPGEEPLNPVPFINVELKSTSESGKTSITDELLLTDRSEVTPRTQRVTVLTCPGWGLGKGGKPPPPKELVELWIASENIHREKGPTLILCHDGVTGCGLYLALSFLLERMAVERECDIILAVRAIRRSRQEFVQSQEQFEYLYDAASEYIDSFEDYANFA